ncbi:MAG: hypothetical protein DCC49_05015 [Acidobacteria bacterium]|nr:MAG: hypothetical protein DCC49_05015 [Acidobacteriota bacterium]
MSSQSPGRTRPSLEPVDLEAVAALRERLESAPVNAVEQAVDDQHYTAMAISRENARRVEPVMAGQDAHPKAISPDEKAAGRLLEVMKARRSCRAFDGRPIPEEHVELILEAGRWAPSAGIAQPWEFVVVTEEGAKRDLVGILSQQVALMKGIDPTFPGYSNPRYLLSTPVIVMPYGDIRATAAYPHPMPRETRRHMLEQSIAMCIENMWLMATQLGLAATNYTMGHPMADARIREIFEVPEHFVMPTMFLVGYPRHEQMPRPRRPLAEIVHREIFDRSRVRSNDELVDFFYSHGVRGRGFR